MSDTFTVGLDLAGNVFQLHGVDGAGQAVQRKKLWWKQVLEFFSHLPQCVVTMEAWRSAHGELGGYCPLSENRLSTCFGPNVTAQRAKEYPKHDKTL